MSLGPLLDSMSKEEIGRGDAFSLRYASKTLELLQAFVIKQFLGMGGYDPQLPRESSYSFIDTST